MATETSGAINSLRNEMRAGFEAAAGRFGSLEGELQRHRGEVRLDMSAMEKDIRECASWRSNFDGKMQAIKWFAGIPSIIAAVAAILNLIRHW